MALIKIQSEDDVLVGIFDINLPIIMTDDSTTVTSALLTTAIGADTDVQFTIDAVPAAWSAAQLSIEVQSMLTAAVDAAIADPHVIPTVSNITRLYDMATGAATGEAYLAPATLTPIQSYALTN